MYLSTDSETPCPEYLSLFWDKHIQIALFQFRCRLNRCLRGQHLAIGRDNNRDVVARNAGSASVVNICVRLLVKTYKPGS